MSARKAKAAGYLAALHRKKNRPHAVCQNPLCGAACHGRSGSGYCARCRRQPRDPDAATIRRMTEQIRIRNLIALVQGGDPP